MSSDRSKVEETIAALKKERDELALQIHLGSMEAKDEFGKAQEKLDEMSQQLEPLKGAVEESAANVFAALELVGEEVLGSFQRIRKSLS